MHEEGHWRPKCYVCLLCATVGEASIGDQRCIGCSHRFDSSFTIDVVGSHVLQCELARERLQQFANYDHLRTHLHTQHDIKNFDPKSVLWSFPVESNWPKECGFCGAKFAQWEGREDHIGAHFLRGENSSVVPLQLFNVESNRLLGMAKHGTLIILTHNGYVLLTKPLQRQLDAIQEMHGIQPA
jgi:hypothetical protein